MTPFVLRLHHGTFNSFLSTSEENVFQSLELYEESDIKRLKNLTGKITNSNTMEPNMKEERSTVKIGGLHLYMDNYFHSQPLYFTLSI